MKIAVIEHTSTSRQQNRLMLNDTEEQQENCFCPNNG